MQNSHFGILNIFNILSVFYPLRVHMTFRDSHNYSKPGLVITVMNLMDIICVERERRERKRRKK